ncbi:hypothetical protein BGZ60DRAFT_121902 [Tricladium varicosporioides]|nr:hypothetical protein BGZ60DRAFT_121902 [Hymenoscyphus varicosporioides]
MTTQSAICTVSIRDTEDYSREVRDHPKPTTSAEETTIDGVDLITNRDSINTGISLAKVSLEIQVKWVNAISDMFSRHPGLGDDSSVRDWDLHLGFDGSVENVAPNTTSAGTAAKEYPLRYRLPKEISKNLSKNGEKVQRAELFALGSVLYHILSGKELLHDETGQGIEDRIVKGEFPDDLWTLSKSPRILGCFSPIFAKELLASRGRGKSLIPPSALFLSHIIQRSLTQCEVPFQKAIVNYIKAHPFLFTATIVGSATSIAALAAPAILGAIGFTAVGPAAGSIAASWQACLGVVEAGSLFAWCQSAAMGGAAVGGILFTGLGGAGLAVGAIVAGALDDMRAEDIPGMKEMFLRAWQKEIENLPM